MTYKNREHTYWHAYTLTQTKHLHMSYVSYCGCFGYSVTIVECPCYIGAKKNCSSFWPLGHTIKILFFCNRRADRPVSLFSLLVLPPLCLNISALSESTGRNRRNCLIWVQHVRSESLHFPHALLAASSFILPLFKLDSHHIKTSPYHHEW